MRKLLAVLVLLPTWCQAVKKECLSIPNGILGAPTNTTFDDTTTLTTDAVTSATRMARGSVCYSSANGELRGFKFSLLDGANRVDLAAQGTSKTTGTVCSGFTIDTGFELAEVKVGYNKTGIYGLEFVSRNTTSGATSSSKFGRSQTDPSLTFSVTTAGAKVAILGLSGSFSAKTIPTLSSLGVIVMDVDCANGIVPKVVVEEENSSMVDQKSIKANWRLTLIIVAIAAGVLLLVLFLCICLCCCRKENPEESKPAEQEKKPVEAAKKPETSSQFRP